MRFLRFGLAVFVLIEAVRNYDVMFGIIGFVLLLQSIFNVGCCNNGACYTGKVEPNDNETKEVIFEEVKSK